MGCQLTSQAECRRMVDASSLGKIEWAQVLVCDS